MTFKTRGSNALEKAQRRLALLKSIDETLDLGNGLTIATYTALIETTRTDLETLNTQAAELDAARRRVTDNDRALAELSERMLSGVASKYGKRSIEYAKAGGSNRKRSKNASASPAPLQPIPTPSNGTAKTAVLN